MVAVLKVLILRLFHITDFSNSWGIGFTVSCLKFPPSWGIPFLLWPERFYSKLPAAGGSYGVSMHRMWVHPGGVPQRPLLGP